MNGLEEENYSLKIKLQESIDLVDECKRFYETKIEEYEKIVNSLIILIKTLFIDFPAQRRK